MMTCPEQPRNGVMTCQPCLPLLRIACDVVALEPSSTPANGPHFWRSMLGLWLHRISNGEVPTPESVGRFRTSELFADFFETAPSANSAKLSAIETAPPPYVIDAPFSRNPTRFAVGEASRFAITLVGHAAEAAPAVLTAISCAAANNRFGAMRLLSANAAWLPDGADRPIVANGDFVGEVPAEAPLVPPSPRSARIRLVSPLIMRANNRPVTPDTFSVSAWVGALVRRVSLLSHFHTDAPLETDFRKLKALASDWRPADMELARYRTTRRSARQERQIDMSGLTGRFTLDLTGREALWPYIWIGQWIHAGKAAALGHGAMRVDFT